MAVVSSRLRSGERFTLGERRYRQIAYTALFTLTLIIFTGAAVRLTGSGLGCPRWPRCTDESFLPPLGSHEMIEFGNRLITGVVGLPCLLAAVGSLRLRPFRRDLVVPSVLLVLGVLVQAIIGGITVLLDLSWEVVILHYVASCALLVAAAVLVWRIRHPAGAARAGNPRATVLGTWALTVYGGLILVAGTFATAAGPHAGGAGTGDYVDRLNAVPLRQMILGHGHAATVLGFLSIGLFVLAWRQGASRTLLRWLAAVAVLIGLQGVIGLIQYHSALPAGVVWVHASLAAVLWLAMVFATLAAGRPQRATARSRPAALAA